jgi:hypothetical protein
MPPTKLSSCDERAGTRLGATCFCFTDEFAPAGGTFICLTRIIAVTKKHFTSINLINPYMLDGKVNTKENWYLIACKLWSCC